MGVLRSYVIPKFLQQNNDAKVLQQNQTGLILL